MHKPVYYETPSLEAVIAQLGTRTSGLRGYDERGLFFFQITYCKVVNILSYYLQQCNYMYIGKYIKWRGLK